jgi:CO/xanthine dehydrogenase FAD-binding subunit
MFFQSTPRKPRIAGRRLRASAADLTFAAQACEAGQWGVRVDVPVREVLCPGSVAEALAVLAQRPEAVPIAGGTDLMVQLRDGRKRAAVLLDLSRLELSGVREFEDGIEIGATTPMATIAADAHIRDSYPALALSAAQVGAWPIQCRATLGGNLANASPAADTAPALLVEDARLVLASSAGERRVSVDGFFHAPGRSALASGELILSVILPPPTIVPGLRVLESFVKVGPRQEQIISVVSLAGHALIAGDGTISDVRLAFGAVAATPVRARHTEQALAGRRPDAAVRREAVRALQRDIAPIDDVRAPAGYRRVAAAVLLNRFLEESARG